MNPDEQTASDRYDRGPLHTYEITWMSGHVEQLRGHQVLQTGGDMLFSRHTDRARFTIHGEIDGRWLMVLTAPVEDIRIIRDITAGEWVL